MKKFIAQIGYDFGYGPSTVFTGEGSTREEAVQACLAKAAERVYCDIITESGLRIPESQEKNLPRNVPEDCACVCFKRGSHNDGHTYEWRYVAVPKGRYIRYPSGERPRIVKDGSISFLDSNSDYYYGLPPGSFEWISGSWVPVRRVSYSY